MLRTTNFVTVNITTILKSLFRVNSIMQKILTKPISREKVCNFKYCEANSAFINSEIFETYVEIINANTV